MIQTNLTRWFKELLFLTNVRRLIWHRSSRRESQMFFCVIGEDTWQPQGCVRSSASFFFFSLCAFYFFRFVCFFFLDFIFHSTKLQLHDMTCCAAVLLCQELHVLSASGERRREQAQCVLHRQQPQQQRRGVGAGGPSIQGLPRTEEPHRRAQKYVHSLLPHSVSVFVLCVGSSCSYPV